jgi:hypothetical protein
VLLGLVGVFVLSKMFRSPKLESNLRRDLVAMDTASVTEIRILPSSARDKVIKLARVGNRWNVILDNKTFEADESSVKTVLEMFAGLDADRMVSRKKEKWETFNVGEKSTNVMAFNGSDQVANVHIGKSGFAQNSGGQFGGGGYTYVRLSDEDEVYSVTGFYESMLNRPFAEWRNKAFLRVSESLVRKISFTYPADSSFVLEMRDSVWYAGAQLADRGKVNTYLGRLALKNFSSFVDDFTPPVSADAIVKLEGVAGVLATVEVWRGESAWVFRSSFQNDVFFSNAGNSVDKELLVGPRYFLTH